MGSLEEQIGGFGVQVSKLKHLRPRKCSMTCPSVDSILLISLLPSSQWVCWRYPMTPGKQRRTVRVWRTCFGWLSTAKKTGILNGPETAWLLCKYNLLVCGHWCFDSPAVQQTISIRVKSGKVSVWLVEMRAKTISAFTVWLVISWCYACTCDAGHMWHHVASIIHHNTKVRSCYIIMCFRFCRIFTSCYMNLSTS